MALRHSYFDLITSQHRDKPKFLSTIDKLLAYSDEIYEVGIYLNGDFDLDEAVGQQQDVIGDIIALDRPYSMDDTQYRVLQRLKIIKNLWNGTISDLYEKWLNLFGIPIYVVDNQDMTLDLYLKTAVNENPTAEMEALRQLIKAGYVMPKPMGVGYNFTLKYLLQFYEDESTNYDERLKLSVKRKMQATYPWGTHFYNDGSHYGSEQFYHEGRFYGDSCYGEGKKYYGGIKPERLKMQMTIGGYSEKLEIKSRGGLTIRHFHFYGDGSFYGGQQFFGDDEIIYYGDGHNYYGEPTEEQIAI